jgi:hypothetical protein
MKNLRTTRAKRTKPRNNLAQRITRRECGLKQRITLAERTTCIVERQIAALQSVIRELAGFTDAVAAARIIDDMLDEQDSGPDSGPGDDSAGEFWGN